MLGEEEAVVLEVKAFDLHGVTYYDLAVGFPDRSVQQARLGAESVPDDLREGRADPRHPGRQHGDLDPPAVAVEASATRPVTASASTLRRPRPAPGRRPS